MQLFRISFYGNGRAQKNDGLYADWYGNVYLTNNRALDPKMHMAKNAMSTSRWAKSADVVATMGGIRLIKSSGASEDQALVVIDFNKGDQRTRIDCKVIQARQIIQQSQDATTSNCVFTMEAGDCAVVSRRWKKGWLRKRHLAIFDVMQWDGKTLTCSQMDEGKWPALSAGLAAAPVHSPDDDKPAVVVQSHFEPRTPLEKVAQLLTKKEASEAELLKAIELLDSIHADAVHDEGRRAVLIESIQTLAKKLEALGNLAGAASSYRLGLVVLYSLPDDGNDELNRQRLQFNSEIERLAKAAQNDKR
jgi:hypothetical protein